MVQDLEVKAISKQLTATIQILASLGAVLAVTFPDMFSIPLGRLASFFKIDLSLLFGVGCYTVNSYATSLLVNIAAVGVLFCAVGAYYNLRLRQLVHGEYTPDEIKEHALTMYNKFDKDGDGIDIEEVRQIAMRIDPNVSDASVKKLFDQAGE